MDFEKLYKSPCKKCKRRGSGKRRCGSKIYFKKTKKLPKKVVNSDIAKMAISQGLAYAPRLYDMGTSRIGNEKVKKLLQSEMGKNLLKKGLDKAHSKL